MQIVINIPDENMPNKQEIIDVNIHFIAGEVCECTYPYIVLPKGHGDLKDAEYLKSCFPDLRDGAGTYNRNIIELIDVAPTIIDADGGDAE